MVAARHTTHENHNEEPTAVKVGSIPSETNKNVKHLQNWTLLGNESAHEQARSPIC